ncbi:GntR family transcriptional regulator [Echinicola sediminis]
MDKLSLEIREDSRVPKYQQLANEMVKCIHQGQLAVGDRIPSINAVSEQYYLSRDTVEKAYKVLKESGVIKSVPGQGYFVHQAPLGSKKRILYLVNKLSAYKLEVFQAFEKKLQGAYQIDLEVFFYDPKLFREKLNRDINKYDYVVMIPLFNREVNQRNLSGELLETIEAIPKEKLVILEKLLPEVKGNYTCVYQDFKEDIYEALGKARFLLSKYTKLNLFFPQSKMYFYPREIQQGFMKFCNEHDVDFSVEDLNDVPVTLKKGQAYIVISEEDMVKVMKKIKDSDYRIGKDVGVLSYNDTSLKSLFDVSVMSTNFSAMGKTAAESILEKEPVKIKNEFKFIRRGSL